MDPSKEAEEELRRMRRKERERDLQRMEEEVVWPQIAIAVAVIVALWALNKFLEGEVRKMETIEYRQEQLKKQQKFQEM